MVSVSVSQGICQAEQDVQLFQVTCQVWMSKDFLPKGCPCLPVAAHAFFVRASSCRISQYIAHVCAHRRARPPTTDAGLNLCCSESAAGVAQVIYNKHTKEAFQGAISRGNPNLVTPVELDFSLPRNVALAQQCQVLLNWETSYKTLSRQPFSPDHDLILSAGLCS